MNQVQNQKADQQHLENQFRDNLQYLAKSHLELYKNVCQYQPKHSFLGIDEQGQYNITCRDTWLYREDQAKIAEKQIQTFLKEQPSLKTSAPEAFENIEEITTLNEYIHREINTIKPRYKKQKNTYLYFPIMIHYGVGLALHLEKLLDKCYTDFTILYEPHMDFFYASLFTTDYRSLENRTKLILIVNKEPQKIIDRLFHFSQTDRIHYLTRIGLFKHYTNEQLHQASIFTSKSYYQTISNNGFLEDECISASHTLSNIKNNARFLKEEHIENTNTAVLIASGPSTDIHLPIIKKHQDRVFIFSCSSSLFICEKNNITPDFHAECERNHAMIEFIEKNNKKNSGKKTHLLTLNPAHPRLKKYFKDVTFAKKGNDLGNTLIKKHIKGKIFNYANPAAGNTALAYALALNFKEIILIGYDCGYEKKEYHHSKESIYFTHDEKTDEDATELTFLSNEGKKIKTSYVLAESKKSIELIVNKSNKGKIYNTGNGAKLNGTAHIDKTQLEEKLSELTSIENKEKETEKMIKKATATIKLEIVKKITKDYEVKLNEILSALKKQNKQDPFKKNNVNEETNIFEHITEVQKKLSTITNKNEELSLLFNGLKQTLGIASATKILEFTDKSERVHAYKKILELSKLYLVNSVDIIKDYTTHNSDQINYKKYTQHNENESKGPFK